MMKDKYLLWGVLGIGVTIVLWLLTKNQIQTLQTSAGGPASAIVETPQAQTNQTPLAEQSNIVGETNNSQFSNGTNFSPSSSNVNEAPHTWAMLPNLEINNP